MNIRTPKELKEIRDVARSILARKVEDYANNFCDEITSKMLIVAADPGTKEHDADSLVNLDFSVNSKFNSINTMRKNMEIRYLSYVTEEIKKRFSNLGYVIETSKSSNNDYHSVKISW